MKSTRFVVTSGSVLVLGVLLGGAATGCQNERKQECEQFLGAMKPLDDIKPSPETIERVRQAVGQIKFADQPLGIYAKNFDETLDTIVGMMRAPSDPDQNTNDQLIATNLKTARTDRDDTVRYCAQ